MSLRKVHTKMQQKGRNYVSGLLILIGLSGAILFFPIDMGGTETCIFESVNPNVDIFHHAATGQGLSLIVQEESSFEHYLSYYSTWWWGSLVLLAMGVFFLTTRSIVLDRIVPFNNYLKSGKDI